ncbi:MAG: DUF72 domain-containing protein [Calditrichaeota bacterium]|nr:MAG: DUF72 domain-containing protein [Calditrichota bacterium]
MANTTDQTNKLFIGPAGWSYADWHGVFYPTKSSSKFDELAYLARYFNVIEINSSYYHPPSVDAARSWIKRVSTNKHFRFTAKLWQKFVLERSTYTNNDVENVQRALDILQDAELLGAVLVQFPQSFKNTIEGRSWLFRVLSIFKMYPLFVEFRHASWNVRQTFDLLNETNAGFVNIDQPVIGNALGFTEKITSGKGYFRFHGQNTTMWFNEKAGRDDRYNYTYGKDELDIFTRTIQKNALEAESIYIIFNNHYKGQALRNAFELEFLLTKEKQNIPDQLIKTYPQLISIRKPEDPQQLELF